MDRLYFGPFSYFLVVAEVHFDNNDHMAKFVHIEVDLPPWFQFGYLNIYRLVHFQVAKDNSK